MPHGSSDLQRGWRQKSERLTRNQKIATGNIATITPTGLVHPDSMEQSVYFLQRRLYRDV